MKIQPVIMSGGSGTRLWPLSRRARPKQFLNLVTDKSLFQETVRRLYDGDKTFSKPLVIAGEDHAPLVAQQLGEIGVTPAGIILEPCPRNTAAVAAVAAAWAADHAPDSLILLSPADHHIEDVAAFHRAISDGAAAARDGAIVTFGLKPTHPHTGYGYIQSAEQISQSVFRIAAFHEKPDAQTASGYFADGGYFWNAGIFLFSARAMNGALAEHAPEIANGAARAFTARTEKDGVQRLDAAAFEATPSDSIDFAVMEKTGKAAVVAPVDMGWTDIGSWSETASDPADAGHMLIDSENTSVRSDGPIIGAIGVDDLVIVATGDAVLVARRDRAQDVRALVEELKRRGREDLL